MSLPIKDTPILRGKDAIKFLDQINENETKCISKEELGRMQKNYEVFKSLLEKSEKR